MVLDLGVVLVNVCFLVVVDDVLKLQLLPIRPAYGFTSTNHLDPIILDFQQALLLFLGLLGLFELLRFQLSVSCVPDYFRPKRHLLRRHRYGFSLLLSFFLLLLLQPVQFEFVALLRLVWSLRFEFVFVE